MYTKEELRYLNAKDFRSTISSWASEHKNGEIRLHAAALQNHSVAVHEAKYRRNKVKQAMGQSLALQKDLQRVLGVDMSSSEEVRVWKFIYQFWTVLSFNLFDF